MSCGFSSFCREVSSWRIPIQITKHCQRQTQTLSYSNSRAFSTSFPSSSPSFLPIPYSSTLSSSSTTLNSLPLSLPFPSHPHRYFHKNIPFLLWGWGASSSSSPSESQILTETKTPSESLTVGDIPIPIPTSANTLAAAPSTNTLHSPSAEIISLSTSPSPSSSPLPSDPSVNIVSDLPVVPPSSPPSSSWFSTPLPDLSDSEIFRIARENVPSPGAFANNLPIPGEVKDHWALVRGIHQCLQFVHDTTGCPWWIAIILTTISFRTLLFPIAVLQQRYQARLAVVMPKLTSYANSQRERMATLTPLAQKMEGAKLSKFKDDLYKEHGVTPLKAFLPSFIMMPFFISMYSGLNSMAEFCPSWFYGGPNIFDFQNLFSSDKTYILPLVNAAVIMIQTQVGFALNPNAVKWMKYLIFAMPICFLPIANQIPLATWIFWITNALFTITQLFITRNPSFRKRFSIPDMPKSPAANASSPAELWKSIKLSNEKARKQAQDMLGQKQKYLSGKQFTPMEYAEKSSAAASATTAATSTSPLPLSPSPSLVSSLNPINKLVSKLQQNAQQSTSSPTDKELGYPVVKVGKVLSGPPKKKKHFE